MKYDFTKMTGAGNDFILFDGINNQLPDLSSGTIREICRRGLGVGADGVLIVLPSNKLDFELQYFNADGTSGMLCANGARASIVYTSERIFKSKKSVEFSCCEKKYSGAALSEDEAVINLPDIKEGRFEKIPAGERELGIYLADTGAPQGVIDFADLNIPADSFDDFDFVSFAKSIRHHRQFSPYGINVNVLNAEDENFKIRSFERGVEGETLACGTGIIAAAMFLHEAKGVKSPIEIFSRSKKKFIINFQKKMSNFGSVSLRGHAAIVYNGNIKI